MSAPIDRSLDPNEVSFYAPKRARDKGTDPLPKTNPAPASDASADISGQLPLNKLIFGNEGLRRRPMLAPSLVPEPPQREPWLRKYEIGAAGAGSRSFMFIVWAVVLAAPIAFGLVVASPTIEHFIAVPTAKDKVELSGAPTADPPPVAGALTPAPTNVWPSGHDGALDPPVNVLGVFDPGIKQPSNDRLSWIHPRRETQEASPRPVIASPSPVAPEPQPDSPAAAAPNAAAAATTDAAALVLEEPTRPLGKGEIETLLKQGHDFVSVGDFSSARLLFKRIAEAGDPRGAFALAVTYDPVALARIGATDAKPDEAKALEWFQKAKELSLTGVIPKRLRR
jgi:hypothetical protein